MKKILCLLCILTLAAGLLAACGKSDPPSPVDGDITTAADGYVPDDFPPAGNDDETQPVGGGNDINTPEDLANALNELGQMFSATWPENEFTKQVPKPKFEIGLGTVTEEGYVVLCGATIPELKDYVKDLQKAGFTKDADTTDTAAMGFTVYNYTANNGKGYYVEIGNAMGMSTISITKAMG